MTALVTDSGPKTPARLAGSAILGLQSDERLVKLFRSGHERAFEAIVERYRKPLTRFSAGILPESRTEDAVQQAFINAHAALRASDEPLQLRPWLYAITRNAALNMLRQNGWNYDQIPLDFDGVRRPDQIVEQRVQLETTVAAMNELPERQRDALVMRELEGRSYDEIALALGTGDGAVRQLLNRARVTLRRAASMLVPPPIVVRAASSLPPSDGRRVAELLGGFGAAGIAKAGATALVAGTLVVGAVEAPLPIGDSHKATREKATLSSAKPPHAAAKHTSVALHAPARHLQRSAPTVAVPAPTHQETSGSGRHGSGSGSDDIRTTGDDHPSDSDSPQRSGSNSGPDSGPVESPSSGSGSSGSGSGGHSGSDDAVVVATSPAPTPTPTPTPIDNSGPGSSSSGPGSGTSGTSGTSGSGSSGTSGSGHSGTSEPLDH
jgi:RNA polymerase sigma factor (sigma-70 family)